MVRRPLRSELARSIADLAIELGDPGRMMRARKLHRAGSVGEISVDPLRLRAPVFGESDSYETEIRSDGSGSLAGPAPEFGRILCDCTCPDTGESCKHSLALLLTFAEEVEDQPHLAARFLDEGEQVPDGVSPVIQQHAFLSNDRLASFTLEPVTPLSAASSTQLVFDGTDAWPVFHDAIETIRRTSAE